MKSQLMTQVALKQLQATGKTLEQDKRGIKVTFLSDGSILKVFRLRGWFSSSLIYSNARSFCRNAQRLKELKILTVSVLSLHHFKQSTDTAVIYQPLAGKTIRELLKSKQLNQEMVEKLGAFIAQLHNSGVCFRSLHFGNIVLTPNFQLGLIDIADMKIYPWTLFASTRLRNIKHLSRYKNDVEMIEDKDWLDFISAYLKASNLSNQQQQRCNLKLNQQFLSSYT